MKQLYYILFLLPLLLCACDKVNDEENSIQVGPDNFIHFTSNIDAKGTTRAPIITNMRGKNFAVLGYKYPKTTLWNAYKALAEPNVFDDTPQTVSCNSSTGICTYSNIKLWENEMAYTFFAYFPTNVSYISSHKGVPYIEYDLPTSTTDPDDLLDVMYAQSNENMLGSSSSTVKFTFYHALFCLYVQAMNLNEEDVVIKNVDFTIDNIAYSHLHLNLDGSPYMVNNGTIDVDETYSGDPIINHTYTILGNNQEITIPPISSTNPNATDVSNYKDASFTNDNNIMLIPQTGMSGTITLTKDGNNMKQDFTSDIDFKPGRKYAVSISFAGDAMSIKIIDSNEWTDSTSDIEFE